MPGPDVNPEDIESEASGDLTDVEETSPLFMEDEQAEEFGQDLNESFDNEEVSPIPEAPPASETNKQTNAQSEEEIEGVLEEVEDPVNEISGMEVDGIETGVDATADLTEEASKDTGQVLSQGIETAGKAADAPLAGMDEGLRQSAESAQKSADEMGPASELSPFEQGLKGGKEDYASMANTLADMGETAEKGLGEATGFTSSAVQGIGDTIGDTVEQAKGVTDSTVETVKSADKAEESVLNDTVGEGLGGVDEEVEEITKIQPK